ncbi:hypothetical protein BU24DRAFT_427589 [Aaosphaeria arxii CBS 175.79]|uniref:Uncharacterized protein n=1 Tax=Aaosphaeria arxii CBS 175.79 TaxID=1450172 RepID=A0A6A5XCG3_9PLEO|nr:uncharacterized protein BU24DRAFT_427589 [Aaosphaeria arxii CBS 175.79]KAF2010464.1 hypothetical protein BU24DRAFT_427589 [Aaosphaeria arxii CBS 175.79]
MPAPLAKGLIIAASVIVAAGIAIYESPQVRQWVDQYRRKIAVALHSLGDEIQPRRGSESSQDYEERKKRRDEIVRRNRNELIQKARAEGVAVDLDELAKIGVEELELAERRHATARGRTNSQKSFDDLVGSDGKLKKEGDTAEKSTGLEAKEDSNLRRRGVTGFAAGAAAGLAMSNPFDDDAQVLFDHETEDEAPSPKPFTYIESRESSATVEGDATPSVPAPVDSTPALIDLTSDPEASSIHPENPQTASIPQSEADDEAERAAQSFYSFTSASSTHEFAVPNAPTSPAAAPVTAYDSDSDPENISTGTLTPRSERSFTTGASASAVPPHADDIAILSMQNDSDHDARSEVFSEGGFTDAGFSEAGFSELGEGRQGILTPSSWTDVGSDDESEWGGPAGQHGHVSQIHQ